MNMKRFLTTTSSLVLAMTVWGGCAIVDREKAAQTSDAVRANTVSQREASDLAFHYRRQAAEYRELAYRLELEARLDASQKRDSSDDLAQRLERAKSLRAAADQADEAAREYRGQAPHNQVN